MNQTPPIGPPISSRELCAKSNISWWKLEYLLRAGKIPPPQMFAGRRGFDESHVEAVRRALAENRR